MDLDSYIGKHRSEWGQLDAAVQRVRRNQLDATEIPELIRLYLRASSHLAEVQTRYRDPALEGYLNALVTRARAAIYGTEARSLRSMSRLFGIRYRQAFHRTLPWIGAVAALLLGILVATDLWVATSAEAQAGAIPPIAREALERIGQGGGGIDEPPAAVSAQIFQNNVQVAFLAFALGALLGIGTLWLIVQNAVFIGLLGGAFQAAGYAPQFWSLVLPHGFLELLAISIAGGAGLRVGWSLVDPGDRLRGTAFVKEARDAVVVVIGVVPAFAIAAIIEGFVTGRTGMPLVEIGIGAVVAIGYLTFLAFPRRSDAGRRVETQAA